MKSFLGMATPRQLVLWFGFALAALVSREAIGQTPCGCMDVALVIDDTGSMGGTIDNVRNGLTNIISTATTASGGDVRMGLVTFKDTVEVDQPLTNDLAALTAAVNLLTAGGG